MTRCPNCGREQADAVVCRHCGIDIAPARSFWEPVVQPIRTSPFLLFWVAVLVLVALVAGWFVWSGKASSLSRSKAPVRALKSVIK